MFASIWSACKSTQLKTERPQSRCSSIVIQSKPSIVSASVSIDLPKLEKSLNEHYNGLVYNDSIYNDDHLMLKVWKTGTVHLSTTADGKINCVMPLKLWVKTGYKKEILGITASDSYELQGEVSIDLSAAFKWGNSCDILAYSTINSYKWTSGPSFKVAGLNIPVGLVANIAIKAMSSKITSAIDQALTDNLDMHRLASEMWTEAQKPVLVDKDYDVWLSITPQNLYATPIKASNQQLRTQLVLRGEVETLVGKKPTQKKIAALPALQITDNATPDFTLNTNVSVTYDKMNDIAQQQLVGQTFKDGSRQIKVDSIGCYPSGDQLGVAVKVSGTVNGTIYCVGTPKFDNNTKTLTIENFDFEMKTKNVLAKSANWLMHKAFLAMIEPKLHIDLKKEIDQAWTSANALFKNYEVSKGVILKGKIEKMDLDQIVTRPKDVVISGSAKGSAAVEIGDIF